MSADGSSAPAPSTELGPFTDVASAFCAAKLEVPAADLSRVAEQTILLHTDLLRLEPSRPGPAAYLVRRIPWTVDGAGVRRLLEVFLAHSATEPVLYELPYGPVLFTVARGQIVVTSRPATVATPIFSRIA